MLCLPDSIRHEDPSVQRLRRLMDDAHSLTALLLAAWQVARVLTVHLVEAVLAERARQPPAWPPCPTCGAALRSQGCATRQMMSLVGPSKRQRRGGRCPQGCTIPPVAPCDAALGGQPPQRTSGALPHLGCALAVFVPFAPAAPLLGWGSGVAVSPRAVWAWGQAAGQRAREQLQEQVPGVDQGDLPPEEPRVGALDAVPLRIGADGVMVPFRPAGGSPQGQTAWHEVKGGVLAR
jgi:hypothetical protein